MMAVDSAHSFSGDSAAPMPTGSAPSPPRPVSPLSLIHPPTPHVRTAALGQTRTNAPHLRASLQRLLGSRAVRVSARPCASPPALDHLRVGAALVVESNPELLLASGASFMPPAPNPVPPGERVRPIRLEIADFVEASLRKAFPDSTDAPIVVANAPNNRKFGDYQCNNAMALFGRLKGKEGAPKSPRAVAEAIAAEIPTDGLVEEVSIAGPGFINLRLSRDWLARRVMTMLRDPRGVETWAPAVDPLRVVVDFSSPNVAKEMHVGHLRSSILGDSICRVLAHVGHDVVRLNHVGDWGTQFGMLIEHMADRPGGLTGEGADENISDLMELYRSAKARFDEDEPFKERSREAVTRLQAGGEAELTAWRRICAASRLEFQKIYDRLGVELDERGESFYNPMLKPLLVELQEKGVVEESDGAQVIWTEGNEIPLIMQKGDGGFGYASTDMAAIQHRVKEEKADWVIYVTDVGQSQHFKLVFDSARKAGLLPAADAEGGTKVEHIGFGLVLGDDGKRFRTRSGDLVRLVELLDEAYERCKSQLEERRPEGFTDEELEYTAKAMGYGAVKYADLKNHRLTNYKFSFDSMLDLKGDTAVYLLYAHARLCSIIRKSGVTDMAAHVAEHDLVLAHPTEVDLALHLVKWPEIVDEMMRDWTPNKLTDYLYETSVRFTAFYGECTVNGSEEQASRLLLCEATAVMMRCCFSLLGLQPCYKI